MPDSLRSFFFGARRQVITGALSRVTADSIYLSVRSSAPFAIARSDVRSVRVSRGESRTWSAVQTAALFGMAGVVTTSSDNTRFPLAARYGIGLTVGAIVGAIWPYEQWKRIQK
ncbi:MAG: hypothetical protein H7099_07950 [Gemmatimonadaceae bacterium]|nr:hypothetical protein [Gemmatimonadaceae bacterium]